jgi:prepilin-type processing-associated H-X9-DG protein
MQCPHCGNPVSDSDRFCPACKMSLDIPSSTGSPPIPTQTKISNLARVSFVLGILSLSCIASMFIFSALGLPEMVFLPFCVLLDVLIGIAGIIVGIIAIIQIYSNRGLQGKIRAVFGTVTSSVSILVVIMSIIAISYAERNAKQYQCVMHVNMIGKAIIGYRDTHQGINPTDFSVLVREANLDPKFLICPAAEDENVCSYIYRGQDLNKQYNPKLILAYDKPINHGDSVRNILFADGHVSKTTKEKFEKAIAKDNQIRRSLGLPEKGLDEETPMEIPLQPPK